MHFEFILLIILFNYLRKNLPPEYLSPRLKKLLWAGLFFSIAMFVIQTSQPAVRKVTFWISHIMLLALIIIITFKRKEFQAVKSLVNAITPIVVLNVTEDLVRLISPSFYQEWFHYFDTAEIFAAIWLIAMLYINRKQKKALEKERLKAEEREQEYKITEKLKAQLEIQVAERTLQLTRQKEELQHALTELKATQSQLIQSEKMASLGELTAGIAHEIQNPLNFINNFSELNNELIEELKSQKTKLRMEEQDQILDDIFLNNEKINHHGKRADAIVKGMLQHSRSSSAAKELTDINALADEYLRLAYHGLRAKNKSFNATLNTDYDVSIGNINIVPQDIGRVILNLINNAFYAVVEKKKQAGDGFEPVVSVSTKKSANKVFINVKDNGNGIPDAIKEKIFQPFFTTKPTGQGTGLGLSLSYDIVKAHGGELKVETKEGEGSEFIIQLPAA
jgi:two-component system, NtrC family, sensor kinase